MFFPGLSDSTCSPIDNNQPYSLSRFRKKIALPTLMTYDSTEEKNTLTREIVIYLSYFVIIILSTQKHSLCCHTFFNVGEVFAKIETKNTLSLGLKLEYENQAERKGEMRNQGLFNWHVCLVAYQYLGPGSKL